MATNDTNYAARALEDNDPLTTLLKWVLFIVGVASLAALAYGTYATYTHAPPATH
ncbi:Nitric-oxide reductase, quinol-dependent [Salinisphaera sp. LB1]|nr:Nitric-oxide reductase, quinol-dependent [Salinisphaera sp. LB1]